MNETMKNPPKRSNETLFEIKIASLGYVSVGKTTVLNALMKGKFSEVSMRRTTASVNYFRIHTTDAAAISKSSTLTTTVASPDSDRRPKKMKFSTVTGQAADRVGDAKDLDSDSIENLFFTADETLTIITKENAKLRDSGTFLHNNKGVVHEKTFDVEIDEPFINEMRADTQLVLVDIPGLNEADTRDIYRDYVTNKLWSTLDCVIVVMDVSQGVNTEEQVQLLELVKQNCMEKKNIPIIVVCNKVDDPDNAELMELVNEVRAKVELIFSNKQYPVDASTNEKTDKSEDVPGATISPVTDCLLVDATPSLLSTTQKFTVGSVGKVDAQDSCSVGESFASCYFVSLILNSLS
jgi:GTPase SAR1 family protein